MRPPCSCVMLRAIARPRRVPSCDGWPPGSWRRAIETLEHEREVLRRKRRAFVGDRARPFLAAQPKRTRTVPPSGENWTAFWIRLPSTRRTSAVSTSMRASDFALRARSSRRACRPVGVLDAHRAAELRERHRGETAAWSRRLRCARDPARRSRGREPVALLLDHLGRRRARARCRGCSTRSGVRLDARAGCAVRARDRHEPDAASPRTTACVRRRRRGRAPRSSACMRSMRSSASASASGERLRARAFRRLQRAGRVEGDEQETVVRVAGDQRHGDERLRRALPQQRLTRGVPGPRRRRRTWRGRGA